MPSNSHTHHSPSTTMTFSCGPIHIDLFLRRMWHPAPDDGWLILDEDGNWQGNVTIPIGKTHVRIHSYEGIY